MASRPTFLGAGNSVSLPTPSTRSVAAFGPSLVSAVPAGSSACYPLVSSLALGFPALSRIARVWSLFTCVISVSLSYFRMCTVPFLFRGLVPLC